MNTQIMVQGNGCLLAHRADVVCPNCPSVNPLEQTNMRTPEFNEWYGAQNWAVQELEIRHMADIRGFTYQLAEIAHLDEQLNRAHAALTAEVASLQEMLKLFEQAYVERGGSRDIPFQVQEENDTNLPMKAQLVNALKLYAPGQEFTTFGPGAMDNLNQQIQHVMAQIRIVEIKKAYLLDMAFDFTNGREAMMPKFQPIKDHYLKVDQINASSIEEELRSERSFTDHFTKLVHEFEAALCAPLLLDPMTAFMTIDNIECAETYRVGLFWRAPLKEKLAHHHGGLRFFRASVEVELLCARALEPKQAMLEQGDPMQEVSEQGIVDQGEPMQEISEHGMPEQGMVEQGEPMQEISEHGMPEQEVAKQEVVIKTPTPATKTTPKTTPKSATNLAPKSSPTTKLKLEVVQPGARVIKKCRPAKRTVEKTKLRARQASLSQQEAEQSQLPAPPSVQSFNFEVPAPNKPSNSSSQAQLVIAEPSMSGANKSGLSEAELDRQHEEKQALARQYTANNAAAPVMTGAILPVAENVTSALPTSSFSPAVITAPIYTSNGAEPTRHEPLTSSSLYPAVITAPITYTSNGIAPGHISPFVSSSLLPAVTTAPTYSSKGKEPAHTSPFRLDLAPSARTVLFPRRKQQPWHPAPAKQVKPAVAPAQEETDHVYDVPGTSSPSSYVVPQGFYQWTEPQPGAYQAAQDAQLEHYKQIQAEMVEGMMMSGGLNDGNRRPLAVRIGKPAEPKLVTSVTFMTKVFKGNGGHGPSARQTATANLLNKGQPRVLQKETLLNWGCNDWAKKPKKTGSGAAGGRRGASPSNRARAGGRYAGSHYASSYMSSTTDRRKLPNTFKASESLISSLRSANKPSVPKKTVSWPADLPVRLNTQQPVPRSNLFQEEVVEELPGESEEDDRGQVLTSELETEPTPAAPLQQAESAEDDRGDVLTSNLDAEPIPAAFVPLPPPASALPPPPATFFLPLPLPPLPTFVVTPPTPPPSPPLPAQQAAPAAPVVKPEPEQQPNQSIPGAWADESALPGPGMARLSLGLAFLGVVCVALGPLALVLAGRVYLE